jgi:hypothetical protein
MALALYDRVQQTGTANTTVSFTLTDSVTGYQSFAVVGNGNTTYYGATDGSGNWEVGVGTYATGGTLTRTTVVASSNSNTAVTFSGTVSVFITYPAENAVTTDTLAYPPAIGGTTPSTGTFTTLTAQTEVLKGTGNNLFLQSGLAGGTSGTLGTTAVAPTSWSFITTANGGTVTYASALSGSGNSIRMAGTTVRTGLAQSVTLISGESYSFSYNIETVTTAGTLQLQNLWLATGATVTATYYVNGVLATASTVPTSNSKVQVVFTVTGSGGSFQFRWGMGIDGTYTGDITVSNPQLEIGSTLNTYVPTTTTAVYGTPTLSFSGVAGLGLQSDGSLYVSPAGTGALQAQKTDSTATGGNARGANAVDWQTKRGSATQVASGTNSVVAGGENNTASSYATFIGAGFGNTVNGGYSFLGGGSSNAVSSSNNNTYAAIVGGANNVAQGVYNFVGAGYSNSGTSVGDVTSQSATMNGTTSVTLSGSNASIKVGQFIGATYISNDTYVAAVSGTSLTLSKAASGSGTATLFFKTPHGVVVGGGNNQATGSYSFIGGGGDAGTAANRNVASGDWSVVAGGLKNVASGLYASSLGGWNNTAGGQSSFVGSGYGNNASGFSSVIGGGNSNQANSTYSSIIGGFYGTTRGINGYTVFPASVAPFGNGAGLSQAALLVLGKQTTDATATVITSDGGAASGTNQVILPSNSAYYFRGEVVAGVTGAGDTKGWYIEGVIKRGAGVGTTALVGTPTVTSLYADTGATTWTVTALADTTNGGLKITVTGQASTTIRWVCSIRTVEMTF